MIDAYSHDSTRIEKRECEEDEEGDREISDRHKGRHRGDHQNLPHCNKNSHHSQVSDNNSHNRQAISKSSQQQ